MLRHCLRLGLGLALAFAFAACAPRAATPAAPAAPAGYDLRGEVVSVSAERRTLLVHHEEIPGYMPAMTMEFHLGDADPAAFREGQRVTGRMFEDATVEGGFRLESIRIVDAAKDSIVAAAAQTLRQDTVIRGRGAYREIGEAVPQFSLYDQTGEVVSLDRFRGQRVVLNFIYTRCPIATMCPAATARMTALQRAARERGLTDLQLISITLEPAYDTPPVLRAYAESHGIATDNFSLLTGPEPAIRDLLIQFGIIAEPGENMLKHSLSTILVGRDGKILHRIDGSTWQPAEFLSRL